MNDHFVDINELVARKMGWSFQDNTIDGGWFRGQDPDMVFTRRLPDYIWNIEAAWEIVEKYVNESGWDFNLLGGQRYGNHWQANFLNNGIWISAEAETAAMAICKAFLKLEDK